jgi:NTE family protein
MTQQQIPPTARKVALALQGGRSHGAFTWGVLDRMLTGTAIDIIGVTGTGAFGICFTAQSHLGCSSSFVHVVCPFWHL